MSKPQARATTGFIHGKNYRKGDIVTETPEVLADLVKVGLVTMEPEAKAAPEPASKKAPEPANKKAPEPENKAQAK